VHAREQRHVAGREVERRLRQRSSAADCSADRFTSAPQIVLELHGVAGPDDGRRHPGPALDPGQPTRATVVSSSWRSVPAVDDGEAPFRRASPSRSGGPAPPPSRSAARTCRSARRSSAATTGSLQPSSNAIGMSSPSTVRSSSEYSLCSPDERRPPAKLRTSCAAPPSTPACSETPTYRPCPPDQVVERAHGFLDGRGACPSCEPVQIDVVVWSRPQRTARMRRRIDLRSSHPRWDPGVHVRAETSSR